MKHKLLIAVVLVVGTILFSGCSASQPAVEEDHLTYEVLNEKEMEKGIDYTLITADVVIDPNQDLFSEELVKLTLEKVLEEIKKKDYPDGITLFAYHRQEEIDQGLGYTLGRAEWWPEGHTFSDSNKENIEDKSTYVTTIDLVDNLNESIPTEQEYAVYDAFVELSQSDDNPIYEPMPEDMTDDETQAWMEESVRKQDNFEKQSVEAVARQFTLSTEEVEDIINKVMNYKL